MLLSIHHVPVYICLYQNIHNIISSFFFFLLLSLIFILLGDPVVVARNLRTETNPGNLLLLSNKKNKKKTGKQIRPAFCFLIFLCVTALRVCVCVYAFIYLFPSSEAVTDARWITLKPWKKKEKEKHIWKQVFLSSPLPLSIYECCRVTRDVCVCVCVVTAWCECTFPNWLWSHSLRALPQCTWCLR